MCDSVRLKVWSYYKYLVSVSAIQFVVQIRPFANNNSQHRGRARDSLACPYYATAQQKSRSDPSILRSLFCSIAECRKAENSPQP